MWVSLIMIVKLLMIVVVLIVTFRNISINLIWVAFYSLNRMQLRVGPQTVDVWIVLQPFADAVKLLTKESILPNHANQIILLALVEWAMFIFLLAPIISLMLALAGLAMLPLTLWAMFIFLIAPILSLVLALIGWAMFICLWAPIISLTLAEWADINIGILYLFAVSSLGAYVVLYWASNSWSSFLGALRADGKLVLVFHTEDSAMFFILFFLMSYFNVLLFWEGWLPIINLAPFSWIPEVVWLEIKVSLFLFIWTRASLPRIRFDNLMHLEWKSFLPLSLACYLFTISKSNLVMRSLASIVYTSTITKAFLYFKLPPYCIHFVSSAFSIYTLFFQLSPFTIFTKLGAIGLKRYYFIFIKLGAIGLKIFFR